MNDKFFELSEEKQSRIINASLEVFSQNEYKHAVTDDIAAKAGISKGLLFYYFHNKKSLFLYLIDYCASLIKEQVPDHHFYEITDFFELLEYTAEKKARMLSKNPYLLEFTVRSFYSTKEEVSKDLDKVRNDQISSMFEVYFKHIDLSKFKETVNPKEVLAMLIWMTDGYIHERRRLGGTLELHEIMTEYRKWTTMFKQGFYKEENR